MSKTEMTLAALAKANLGTSLGTSIGTSLGTSLGSQPFFNNSFKVSTSNVPDQPVLDDDDDDTPKKTVEDIEKQPILKFQPKNPNTLKLQPNAMMEMMKSVIKFKKLTPDAVIPSFAHDGDLGVDLTVTDVEYDADRDRYIYHTGIACESPRYLGCFAMPQSRNVKTEVYLANSIGLIDTFTYRGEICLIYKNRTCLQDRVFKNAFNSFMQYSWVKRMFRGWSLWRECVAASTEFEMKNALYDSPYGIGETCGQLVFYIRPEMEITEVDELSETERGVGGFGSSKKKK